VCKCKSAGKRPFVVDSVIQQVFATGLFFYWMNFWVNINVSRQKIIIYYVVRERRLSNFAISRRKIIIYCVEKERKLIKMENFAISRQKIIIYCVERE
jgi:hypothetical protein